MYPVDEAHCKDRIAAWQRVPPAERIPPRHARDQLGRPCVEFWARGKCYVRLVAVSSTSYCAYADKGMRRRNYDAGKISFGTWDEADRVFGDGKPHRMPMVPRR